MTFFANSRASVLQNYRVIALICSWLFGFLFGYIMLEPFFFPLMRSSAMQSVSIVGLLVSIFLPFFFSYFAVISHKPIIILIVCFLKAVAFGFSGALISQMFYSASWLVRFLLMFSDFCFMPVLFTLWIRRFSTPNICGMTDFVVTALLGVGITAVDYFCICPIVIRLF